MSWTDDGGADPRRIIAKREIRDGVVSRTMNVHMVKLVTQRLIHGYQSRL